MSGTDLSGQLGEEEEAVDRLFGCRRRPLEFPFLVSLSDRNVVDLWLFCLFSGKLEDKAFARTRRALYKGDECVLV